MRIELSFKQWVDLDALEKGVRVDIIRIFANVKFKQIQGWSEVQKGIIDTGSPISVIPLDLWKECLKEKLYHSEIKGVVPLKKAVIPAIFGKVECIFLDRKNVSPIFNIYALLSEIPDVPLILGFSNLLEKMKLIVNYPEKKCWVEI